jgi:hypothetical protein
MILKEFSFYRIQIKAKNNIKENIDVDRIYELRNAKFCKNYGFGFTMYEASLMQVKITKASEKRYIECNKDESYRELGCM